jgi:hypothetical protein
MRRTLLASSFALSLVACADQTAPTSTVDKPNDGKEDSISRLCEELGEPATCDPCDAAGWYGDGVCDTFCANPDTQDCPVSETAAFLARTDLATSYRQVTGGYYYTSFVATELSQTTADTWADANAALVGNGLALHVRFQHSSTLTATPQTFAITSSVGSTGECVSYIEPESIDHGVARVNVFHWSGAQPTAVVCSRGGAVIAKRVSDKVTLTVLAELSDGTSLEQTFEADAP